MKPGDIVTVDGVGDVTLLRFDPRHPMCQRGKRLGPWSNNFYRPMWQVNTYRGWVWLKAGRIELAAKKNGVQRLGAR